MYIPEAFRMDDADIVPFIQAHSFAILFSASGGQPEATHLPLLWDPEGGERGRLVGHFARANPHWRRLAGQSVLAVFAGPHAYVSPAWLANPQAVPTWNYTAVHVLGTLRILDDLRAPAAALAALVRFYEPSSPLPDQLSEPYFQRLQAAVVAFEIAITRFEGKAKLSQNKSADAIRGAIDGLRETARPMALDIADLMQKNLTRRERNHDGL